jgi:phosphoadenosine phosphosulfate reductase
LYFHAVFPVSGKDSLNPTDLNELVIKTLALLEGKTPEEILSALTNLHPGRVAFSTSLGAEDQVLTHMIATGRFGIRLFTLDTGRMFPETYELMDITKEKYGINLEVCFPDASSVQKMVNDKGINLFYKSVENRKLCCYVRKIEPLKKALSGAEIWISGLRRDQSVTRNEASLVEWDEGLSLLKVNPLISWTHEQVWEFIRTHKIPYNTLHDHGYPSIGCQPCTRAVLPGEDIRAGRWWWERQESKECGLHVKKEG